MKKPIKIFEAFLGDKFLAWKADDRTEIKLTGRIVTVITTTEDFGALTSRFNLDLIPAYSVA